MWIIGASLGLAVIVVILVDAFETILLPRRVSRVTRLTRLFYQILWKTWRFAALRISSRKRRGNLLSVFAPLSLPLLYSFWGLGLITGFAILHVSLGTAMTTHPEGAGLETYFYFSGVTFLTLGYGDLAPTESPGRFLAVLEAGVGFVFLAIVIGYLPVIYQAFSRRELPIALLDARAGSPPTAAELLARLGSDCGGDALDNDFANWELWAAEILESHLSFPILALYRSQHDNQSWLAALTMILDASAIVIAGLPGYCPHQARLTFAMARHAAVDLAQTFLTHPKIGSHDRLDPDRLRKLISHLRESGVPLEDGDGFGPRLAELRSLYEPFVEALSDYCLMPLPPILTDVPPIDNWRTSAWMRRAGRLGQLARHESTDDHDD